MKWQWTWYKNTGVRKSARLPRFTTRIAYYCSELKLTLVVDVNSTTDTFLIKNIVNSSRHKTTSKKFSLQRAKNANCGQMLATANRQVK